MLTLCADFSETEQDREKEEQVQTIKGPPPVGALLKMSSHQNSVHFNYMKYQYRVRLKAFTRNTKPQNSAL